MTTFRLTLRYDPAILLLRGAMLTDDLLTLGETSLTTTHRPDRGELTVVLTSPAPLRGPVNRFLLDGIIPTTAALSVQTDLDLVEALFNGTLPPATVTMGSVTVGAPSRQHGDVNGNGQVTMYDAVLILRLIVGHETITGLGYPTLNAFLAIADVNHDGRISPLDAALIMLLDAGKMSAFPGTKHVASGTPRILTVQHTEDASILTTSLLLDDMSGVQGVYLTLAYDPRYSTPILPDTSDGEAIMALRDDPARGMVTLAAIYPQTSEVSRLLGALRWNRIPGVKAETFLKILMVELNDGAIPVTVKGTLPITYALEPPSPNPFNPVTQLRYQLPASGRVTLVVYNLLGQAVRKLVDQKQLAGRYTVVWDGRDGAGREVASGMYLARLVVDEGRFTATRKLVLLR